MITENQLFILIKFRFDPHLLQQHGTTAEQASLAAVDVEPLLGLLQDLTLYHRGLTAPAYTRKMYSHLLATCANKATAQLFIGYASTL